MLFPKNIKSYDNPKSVYKLLMEVVLNHRLYLAKPVPAKGRNNSYVYRQEEKPYNADTSLNRRILERLENTSNKFMCDTVEEFCRKTNRDASQLSNKDYVIIFVQITFSNDLTKEYLMKLIKDTMDTSVQLKTLEMPTIYATIPKLMQGLSNRLNSNLTKATDADVISLAMEEINMSFHGKRNISYEYGDDHSVVFPMEKAIGNAYTYLIMNWIRERLPSLTYYSTLNTTGNEGEWLSKHNIGGALWEDRTEKIDYMQTIQNIKIATEQLVLNSKQSLGAAYNLIHWAQEKQLKLVNARISVAIESEERNKPMKQIHQSHIFDTPPDNLTRFNYSTLLDEIKEAEMEMRGDGKVPESKYHIRASKLTDLTLMNAWESVRQLNEDNVREMFMKFADSMRSAMITYYGTEYYEYKERKMNGEKISFTRNDSDKFVLNPEDLFFLEEEGREKGYTSTKAFTVFEKLSISLTALEDLIEQLNSMGMTILDIPRDIFGEWAIGGESRWTNYNSLKEMLHREKQIQITSDLTQEENEEEEFSDGLTLSVIDIGNYMYIRNHVISAIGNTIQTKVENYKERLQSYKLMTLEQVLQETRTGEIIHEEDTKEDNLAQIDTEKLLVNLKTQQIQLEYNVSNVKAIMSLINYDLKQDTVYWEEKVNEEDILAMYREATNKHGYDSVLNQLMHILATMPDKNGVPLRLMLLFNRLGISDKEALKVLAKIVIDLTKSNHTEETKTKTYKKLFEKIGVNYVESSDIREVGTLAYIFNFSMEMFTVEISEWYEVHAEYFNQKELSTSTKVRIMMRHLMFSVVLSGHMQKIHTTVSQSLSSKESIVRVDSGQEILPLITALNKFKSNKSVYNDHSLTNDVLLTSVNDAMVGLGISYTYRPKNMFSSEDIHFDTKLSYVVLDSIIPKDLVNTLTKFVRNIEIEKKAILARLGVRSQRMNESVKIMREYRTSLEMIDNDLEDSRGELLESRYGYLGENTMNPTLIKFMKDKVVRGDSPYITYKNGEPVMRKVNKSNGLTEYSFIHKKGFLVTMFTDRYGNEQYLKPVSLTNKHITDYFLF